VAQGAQTADRAIQVLLTAVEADEPLGLSELAERSGINKPGTYRLVQALVDRELLERDPGTRRYVVGIRLIALSGAVLRKVSIRQTAGPFLRRIAAITSETVSLHVRHHRHHICVDVVESAQTIRRVVPIGEIVSLLEGTAGKVMLGALPEDELREMLTWANAEGRDVKRLEAAIRQARADGWYAAVGDRVVGAGALSVPLYDSLGLKGAITVAGPGERFGLEAMAEVAQSVREECAELSAALGALPTPVAASV
jgi:IclR family transcriptional regulator, KDG regulon repressor